MKNLSLLLLLFFGIGAVSAQNIFYTKTGHIWFFSSTPVEDIEAHNNNVTAAFDAENNILEFKLKMTDFIFDKALMQEHFNENYVESDKFPYASFAGGIKNFADFDLDSFETFDAQVSGTLKIHGVEQTVSAKGTITKNAETIHMNAKFQIKPADYKIKIPKIVVKNIAEVIDVTVDVMVNPVKK